MGAVVRIDEEGNFYKVHRVLMPDGSTFIYENNRTNAETAAATTDNDVVASPTDIDSTITVSQSEQSVNPQPLTIINSTQSLLPKVNEEKINPGARQSVREVVGDIDNTKYNIPKISTPVFKDDNGAKLPENKYSSALRKYMLRMFKGKILDIGKDNKVYISKRGIEEYAYPAKRLDNDIKIAKQAAGSSLDETLKPAMFLINLPDDGRHPEATGGWDNFYVMFDTDNGVYSGIVKTKKLIVAVNFMILLKYKKKAQTPTPAMSTKRIRRSHRRG